MIRREKVHVEVDDSTIAGGDPRAIIQPVWWLSTIYDGPGMYEHSLRQFSQSQRIVRAILLYVSEVCNGGHSQFYSNSSGIVWRDAMAGFEAISVPKGAAILAISAERLGGSPSLDRDERNEQLDAMHPDFGDVDEALYELKQRVNLDEKIMAFIQ
jgi:hypothetical protein